jgi:aminoglycoside phosphotransferase (APT) family kinase protein
MTEDILMMSIFAFSFIVGYCFSRRLTLRGEQLDRKERSLNEWSTELVRREDELNAQVEFLNSDRPEGTRLFM